MFLERIAEILAAATASGIPPEFPDQTLDGARRLIWLMVGALASFRGALQPPSKPS